MDAGADGVQDQAIAGTHYAMTIFLKSRPVMAAFLLTGRDQHAMTPEGCGHVVKKSDTAILVVSEAATRGDCQAQARYKSERGAVVGKLNVAVYKKKHRKLAIRSVTSTPSQPFAFNEMSLQTYLNEVVYNQAIISWDEVELYDYLVIPYDQNENGCLDVGGTQDEANTIITFPNAIISNGNTTTIFLVSCIYDHSRAIHPHGIEIDKTVLVKHVSAQGFLNYVIAHELGHAAFGLKHTCSSAEPLGGCHSLPYNVDDENNIMWRYVDTVEGFTDSPKLRFWQWKQMQHIE